MTNRELQRLIEDLEEYKNDTANLFAMCECQLQDFMNISSACDYIIEDIKNNMQKSENK